MVLASTTMRPNDLLEIDEYELASWKAQRIFLDTTATTEAGRYKAALAQSPIDGPSATTPAPDAVRADRSRSSAPRPSRSKSNPAQAKAAAPGKATAKKAAPAKKAAKPATTETAAPPEAPATTEAATPPDNAPAEAQKENETR